MAEALRPPTSQKPEQYLAIGIAASVALHLILSALLLAPGRSAPSAPQVSYVDLTTMHPPAPMSAPEKAPTKPAAPVAKAPAPQPQEVSEKAVEEAPAPAAPAAPASAAPQTAEKQMQPQTSLGLGMAKGYFRSLGNGETLRVEARGYYLDMLQRINERWWLDEGVDKKGVRAIMVSLTIARSGEIVDTRLLQSSGNRAYDKAVLKALAAAGPLPPLPAEYRDDFFMAPIRLVPPLNLMSW